MQNKPTVNYLPLFGSSLEADYCFLFFTTIIFSDFFVVEF